MYFYHRISTTAPTTTAPANDASSSTSFRSAYATAAACNHSSAVTDTYYVDPEQSGKLLVLFRIMQVRLTHTLTRKDTHLLTHTCTHKHKHLFHLIPHLVSFTCHLSLCLTCNLNLLFSSSMSLSFPSFSLYFFHNTTCDTHVQTKNSIIIRTHTHRHYVL